MPKRRRKNRTHVEADPNPHTQSPKSFVLKSGSLGSSLKVLVSDLRSVMEPNTASKLRERKSNKLKDFLAMAGPLGVSHMMVLSQPQQHGHNKQGAGDQHVTLKLAKVPRGPTLSFRVLRYALMRDVLNASKKPHSPGKEFQTEPMLILNNFSQQPGQPAEKQVQLVAQTFQSLFPSIKVHDMALTSARRIVLLSYDPTTRTIQFRHYLISIRPVGVTRTIRKIIEGTSTGGPLRKRKGLLNLANASDISDYVLSSFNREGSEDGGAFSDAGTTDNESEAETDLSEDEAAGKESRKMVRLPAQYLGRNNPANSKRAVRLTELGPRMELGLVKIDSGMAVGGERHKESGEVLFHEFVKKSQKEVDEMRRKSNLKEQRRKEQEANVRRKAKEQEERGLKPKDKDAKKQKESAGKEVRIQEPQDSDAEGGSDDDYEVVAAEPEDELDDGSDEEEEEEEDSDLEPIPMGEEPDADDAEEPQRSAPPAKKARSVPRGGKVGGSSRGGRSKSRGGSSSQGRQGAGRGRGRGGGGRKA